MALLESKYPNFHFFLNQPKIRSFLISHFPSLFSSLKFSRDGEPPLLGRVLLCAVFLLSVNSSVIISLSVQVVRQNQAQLFFEGSKYELLLDCSQFLKCKI